jgi:hypothetical protein
MITDIILVTLCCAIKVALGCSTNPPQACFATALIHDLFRTDALIQNATVMSITGLIQDLINLNSNQDIFLPGNLAKRRIIICYWHVFLGNLDFNLYFIERNIHRNLHQTSMEISLCYGIFTVFC